MVEARTIHFGHFKVNVTLTSTDGDAHSKLGDNPSILKALWLGIASAMVDADSKLRDIPSKAMELAEGCK